MKILKFGGTSVGSPERMRSVWEIASAQENPKIIVLSAVAGTTNQLVKLTEHYIKGEREQAKTEIAKLKRDYQDFIKALLQTSGFQAKATDQLEKHIQLLEEQGADSHTTPDENLILAQGELLSTFLFHLYLEEQGITASLLPALSFMRVDEQHEPDTTFIRTHLQELLSEKKSVNTFITQGFICRNSLGKIDNLHRGGSDYTASLIGAALKAEAIQIWTDIDGVHNNDPRYVNHTTPIKSLSFDEAAELAYFGAKILHPKSVHPAKKQNIPVYLLNTGTPEQHGTLIKAEANHHNSIVAISAKDGITAIRIKSSRMLMAYGFLRKLFAVFECYQTPIDMITTSEVAVSLTIDQTKHLQPILAELQAFGQVRVDHRQTIVCLVGNFGEETHGIASTVFDAIKHLPVRMISHGGSEHNISFLIPQEHKTETLRSLHSRIF